MQIQWIIKSSRFFWITIIALWAFLLVWIAIAIAKSDVPLVVKGDTQIMVKSVPFSVEAPPGSDLYFWSAPPGVTFVEKGPVIVVGKATSGLIEFKVRTLTVDWNAKKTLSDIGTITVLVRQGVDPDPGPKPDPKPDPEPDPEPLPVVTKLHLLVIEETKDASNNRAEWLTYKPLHDLFKAKGYFHNIIDKDVKDRTGQTPKWLVPYLSRTKTLPHLFLVNDDGTILYAGPLPESPPQLLGLIKKVGG